MVSNVLSDSITQGRDDQAGKEEKLLHFDPKAAHKTLTQWCKSTETMRVSHREAALSYGRIVSLPRHVGTSTPDHIGSTCYG